MITHKVTGGGELQLAVHEYGRPNGKPILFIHGINQSHLIWSRQYQSALAEEFRLVFLDNRGHGMSEKPTASDHYTQPELWADDVHAVISQLQLHKPTSSDGLMGDSLSTTTWPSMERLTLAASITSARR